MKVPKKMNYHFNDVPTLLEEGSGKAIGTGSIVTWQLVDCASNLILDEWFPKTMQVRGLEFKFIPIEV
jgi:hypothetical protein